MLLASAGAPAGGAAAAPERGLGSVRSGAVATLSPPSRRGARLARGPPAAASARDPASTPFPKVAGLLLFRLRAVASRLRRRRPIRAPDPPRRGSPARGRRRFSPPRRRLGWPEDFKKTEALFGFAFSSSSPSGP